MIEDMLFNEALKEHLETLSRRPEYWIRRELNRGDLVPQAYGLHWYVIDDLNIYREFGSLKDIKAFTQALQTRLRPDEDKILHLFQKHKIIPFSQAVENGLGACLEKHVLTQLAGQREMDIYLIGGFLVEKEGMKIVNAEDHAFQIFFLEDEPLLVDVSYLVHDVIDNKVAPYVVPIAGFVDVDRLQTRHDDVIRRVYMLKRPEQAK